MANRLQLFPKSERIPALPWPSANGKAHAPDEVKDAGPVISFAPVLADFIPLDDRQGTYELATRGLLAWYRVSDLAYACMAFRAQKLSEPPIWITEEEDGDESWIPAAGGHPMAQLLKRPNADMRMRAFLWISSLYLDATGRCVWVKVREGRGGLVTALRPFSDDDVLETERGDGRLFNRFRIQTADGPEWFRHEDVIHLHDQDPADWRKVVSPLMVAARRLGIDRRLAESIKRALLQAVVPGSIISYEGVQFSPPQREELKASFQTQYGGALNQGKPLVLENATYTQNTLGFKGLEGGKLGEETEARVCMAFGVPPVMMGATIGLRNSSDRHNMETSRDLLYENVVVPRWTQIEEALTDDLLPEFDTRADVRFVRFDRSKVKAFQEDIAQKATVSKDTADVLTINERRALLGYEDLPDGDVIAPKAPAPVPAAADPPKALPRPRAQKASADEDAVRLLLHDATLRASEVGWRIAAQDELDRDAAAIVRLMDAGKARKDGPPEPAGAEWVAALIRRAVEYIDAESAPRWRSVVERLVQGTGSTAAEQLAAEVGISFDLLQPGLIRYTQREAAWLVTQVSDTTKQAIRDALSAGLEAGESIPQLAERIRQAGAFSPSRAELIARTETARVTNGGQVESLQDYVRENGGSATKRWIATVDARVRDAHLAMNGETVGIDAPFSNGLMHPGEPNCRCAVALALED